MGTPDDAHRLVKDAYGSVARKAASCCGPRSACCCDAAAAAAHPVPEAELGLSCGDPVAFCHLHPGDVVLDLGSGGGKDVFLAAQKVGPAGRAIGVDMTPEMLALARRNAEAFAESTGLANVEFREGTIEALPAEDASIDVVISNCVINLSPDKPQVFREVHRVLRPGGRMVVSDIVLDRPLPAELRGDAGLYAACIAGALVREDYLDAIRAAGFAAIEVLTDQVYHTSSCCDQPFTDKGAELPDGIAASITVLAIR